MAEGAAIDTRQVILDSAIHVFARKGYAGASIHDILEATGLSKPTLYYHFESKAGLFRAILDRAHDQCLALMQASVSGIDSIEERLIELAFALFQFAEQNQHLVRLMLASVFSAAEEIPPECIDMIKRRRNFEFILGLIREAQAAGQLDSRHPPEEVTHGIFGAISHHIRTYLLLPFDRLDRNRARRIVALFLDGARTHAKPRQHAPSSK
jgi:AcrR family transcriptional regulator